MTKKKKMIIAAAGAAVVLIAGISGIVIWKKSQDKFKNAGKIYVTPVSEINTAAAFSGDMCFSGVVEPQKSYDIKWDPTKKIKDIFVKEGDEVVTGDKLFTYDIDYMTLELEQAELEVDRMNNEISSNKKQITELESEKKNASSDEKFSYTTQIQSLETDNAKLEYDIKVKKSEIEKIKNSISNSEVVSEVSGTVGKVNTALADADGESSSGAGMYDDGQGSSDVVVSITENGSFRIKGRVNEQNMAMVSEGMPMMVCSRSDQTLVWNGMVSEISSEPVNSNNAMYGGDNDEMTSSSNYNFYVEPEMTEGLMLGQHVIIKPGSSDSEGKSGIWIYEDYLVTDEDGDTFVWAADKKDRLEKRYVEIGGHDENFGDCEITGGLDNTDMIAYPDDSYEEGMHTTTDMADAEMPGGDDNFDDGGFDEDMPIDGEFDDMMPDDGIVDDGGAIDTPDGGVTDDAGTVDTPVSTDSGSSSSSESSIPEYNIIIDSDTLTE